MLSPFKIGLTFFTIISFEAILEFITLAIFRTYGLPGMLFVLFFGFFLICMTWPTIWKILELLEK